MTLAAALGREVAIVDELLTAWRSVIRSRGLAGVLLISLGLGTGANATVFTAVNRLLFEAPSGVADPSTLVEIFTAGLDGSSYGPSSYPDFESIAALASFTAVAAADESAVKEIAFGGVTLQSRVAAVSPSFFGVLGMGPFRGRLPAAADTQSTSPTAAISYLLWTTFGAPEDMVGRAIQIAGREYVVEAITPDGFRGLHADRVVDVWVPLSNPPTPLRGDRRLALTARLKPGVRIESARHQLRQLGAALADEFPATNKGTERNAEEPRMFGALPFSKLDPDTRQSTAIVAVVVGGTVLLLLASACVNAGSLLLSRALARRREIAVKMALGATRPRVMRQLFAETLMIALAGALLGLLFAFWTSLALPALFAPEHVAMLDTAPGARTILLTVLVSALAGAIFGIVPAIQGTAESPATALRGDSGEISEESRRLNWRGVLVVAQFAVSVVLLIATGLLATSLSQALDGDLGFLARNVAVLTLDKDTPVTMANQDTVAQLLKDVPDVRAISWAEAPPLTRGAARRFRIESAAGSAVTDAVELNVNVVAPGYFSTMQLPLTDGRLFSAADHGLADPVVVVDEALARRYFAGKPVGRVLIDPDGERIEIVGVVRSGRYRTLQEAPAPTVYYSTRQVFLPRGNVIVRTSEDPAPLLGDLTRLLTRAGISVQRSATLEGRLAETLALDRIVTSLAGVCGLIAVVLATIGVYGVISDAVRRRTREIGLRVALGAGRMQVVRLVVSEALLLTFLGVAGGLLSTLALRYLARAFVFEVPALDPYSLTVTPGMLALVVAAAAVLPLRRALRVSPTIALRAQ